MSVTRRMRRQYERTHCPQLIAAAGQRYIADHLRSRPRFVPQFVWILLLRAVFKPNA